MKFEINSSNITFEGKDFISFFESLNKACNHFKINYFVVGAFSRDIILKNIFNQPTGLATQGIDVAIQLDTWEKYQQFTDYLKEICNFKEGINAYTFISPEGVLTDVLPYGKVETNRTISFPPNFKRVINMFGFKEVGNACIEVRLDGKIDIKIASIEGIAILKFIAWKDREPEQISEKHARDIGLIFNAYYDAMVSEFAVEFSDLFDEENFDATRCGARALGRRMRQISGNSKALVDELITLFSYVLKAKYNSLFATQLSISMRRDYEFCYQLIDALAQGFQEFQP